MAQMGPPISLDGVAVHPDCWCICPYYLHFAPDSPEDGEMYLLVQLTWVVPDSPESCKMIVCVCVCVLAAEKIGEGPDQTKISLLNYHPHHTHNHFTALLEYVRDHPGEQVLER